MNARARDIPTIAAGRAYGGDDGRRDSATVGLSRTVRGVDVGVMLVATK